MVKKHLKIFFSRTKKASRLNLVTEHWGLKVIQVCSNDDLRLTFDLFKARSNLRSYAFVRENIENSVSQKYIRLNGCNLQCMVKVAKPFSFNQIFPPGLSALAPGLYTCINSRNL